MKSILAFSLGIIMAMGSWNAGAASCGRIGKTYNTPDRTLHYYFVDELNQKSTFLDWDPYTTSSYETGLLTLLDRVERTKELVLIDGGFDNESIMIESVRLVGKDKCPNRY